MESLTKFIKDNILWILIFGAIAFYFWNDMKKKEAEKTAKDTEPKLTPQQSATLKEAKKIQAQILSGWSSSGGATDKDEKIKQAQGWGISLEELALVDAIYTMGVNGNVVSDKDQYAIYLAYGFEDSEIEKFLTIPKVMARLSKTKY